MTTKTVLCIQYQKPQNQKKNIVNTSFVTNLQFCLKKCHRIHDCRQKQILQQPVRPPRFTKPFVASFFPFSRQKLPLGRVRTKKDRFTPLAMYASESKPTEIGCQNIESNALSREQVRRRCLM